MKINELKKNSLFVGRGATALYLILDTLMKNKEVIVPSNICYAAVFPIIYSNNLPVFVDINKNTGNATYDEIIKLVTENTGAIIYPYMYGNVSYDILKLKEYCNNNNIILIEDCASSMGATIDGKPVGTIGDYSIFSTGHAKIIDAGNGGILCTDNDISDIEKKYNSLELYNKKIEEKLDLFSKKYRVLRNHKDILGQKKFFNKDYKDMFIYKLDTNEYNKILSKISNLPNILKTREKKYNIYIQLLKKSDNYKILEYTHGSTPWRFTIIVNDIMLKNRIVDEMLKENLFVSDWYPCIGIYFSEQSYKNAEYMEPRILNFSLTDDELNIQKICNILNKYL